MFLEKWSRYGKTLHFIRLAVDIAVLGTLMTIAFTLKGDPEAQAWLRPVAVVLLVTMLVLTEEEIRIVYLWWKVSTRACLVSLRM